MALGSTFGKAFTRQSPALQARSGTTLNLNIWAPAFTGFGGGIGAFSRAMATGVKELGHHADLYGKRDASGSWDGMKLSGCGNSELAQTQRFALLCLGAAVRNDPDGVISTHLNFGPVAHLAKKVRGTPFTLVAHGIDVHPKLPRSALGALRAADRVVAVSAWTKKRVIALGVHPEKVRVLPNTFDEHRFTPGEKSAALIERYRLAPDEKVILTVARLNADEKYKGYDRMVEALPLIRAAYGVVRLIIVGGGNDAARVRELARKVGVETAVTLAGFVSDEELPDHYRLADVFAMPSSGEGFGIVYLEAMGCGTPVLTGNSDGSADAVAGGDLGLMVNPLDVKAIADGVTQLLRGRGPSRWFERARLRDDVVARFGKDAFRENLRSALLASRARVHS